MLALADGARRGHPGRVSDLTRLFLAIGANDQRTALRLLDATPSLATACVARRDEFFLADRLAQVYEGDTSLHAAAFSYDPAMARELVTRGADIRARNRRGAEPLHSAVNGVPGSADGTHDNSGRSFGTSSRRVPTPTQRPPAA